MSVVTFPRCKHCGLKHERLPTERLEQVPGRPAQDSPTHQAVCPTTQKPIRFRYTRSGPLNLPPTPSAELHLKGITA